MPNVRHWLPRFRGVAMFVHEGVPGDELRVGLNTSGSNLRPANPNTTFLLSPKPDIYVFKSYFDKKKAGPPPKRKKVKGPLKIMKL